MGKQSSTVWGIHAGRTGDANNLFLKHNVVALGWEDTGDISKLAADREAFKAHVKKSIPAKRRDTIPTPEASCFALPTRSRRVTTSFTHRKKTAPFILVKLSAPSSMILKLSPAIRSSAP